MQIQSSVRKQVHPGARTLVSEEEKQQDTSNFTPPTSPSTTDSVETHEGAEGVRHVVGGISGVGLSLAGVYAGVLGGAVVGSLFGAGMGPAVASVSSKGALGFLSGIWNSTSTAAQVGMVIGGASGLVGGFKLGSAIGDKAAKWAGAPPVSKKAHAPLNGRGRTATTVITGLGSTSGMIGGALIGAGAGATGSILAQGFDLARLGGASLTGAGLGLVAGAAIAGAGSYLLARETMDLTARGESKDGKRLSGEQAKKALVVGGGAILGGIAGATPLLGGIANGIVGFDAGGDGNSLHTLGSISAFVSAGTNFAGAIGWTLTGNPLWMVPAAATGAVAHGVLHASGGFKDF